MKLSKIWVWDPEKTYSGSRIPDPGIKKAPDQGSGSTTLHLFIMCRTEYFFLVDLNQRFEDPEAKADFEKGMVVRWICQCTLFAFQEDLEIKLVCGMV
jgi:hypothetical protein